MPAGSMIRNMKKPLPNEYAAFYKGYIDSVPDGDIFQVLSGQSKEFVAFIKSLKSFNLQYKYGDNKWSVAEVLGHIIDVERVMAYRLLRFSRNDNTVIPGFDENDYVAFANFNDRSLESFVADFEGLRISNLEMIRSLTEEQSIRRGESNGAIFSVRALVFIIAGHLNHHWKILEERYIPGLTSGQ